MLVSVDKAQLVYFLQDVGLNPVLLRIYSKTEQYCLNFASNEEELYLGIISFVLSCFSISED